MEHECVFTEEREPSGRLIVTPCLQCNLSAFQALIYGKKVEAERNTLQRELVRVQGALTIISEKASHGNLYHDDAVDMCNSIARIVRDSLGA